MLPVMRPCRLVTYTGATIAFIWMCLHISTQADESTGLFDSDPRHVSNQLYRQLHVRTDPEGKEYGFDALDPLLWRETSYLLSGISHAQALALADKFLRTHAERQITDPVKRAILQRDLWAVFDWTDEPAEVGMARQVERRELKAKLVPILQRLALSLRRCSLVVGQDDGPSLGINLDDERVSQWGALRFTPGVFSPSSASSPVFTHFR